MGLLKKICGLTEAKNIMDLLPLQPDFLGFIFYPLSPRRVNPDMVSGIRNLIPSRIKTVGVFVNETPETVLLLAKELNLDIVQLHGTESPQECRYFRSHHLQVWKAFSLHATFQFSTLVPYQHECDMFLFDAYGKSPGGNGLSFDWSLLQRYKLSHPFLLAGGIQEKNADQILQLSHPFLAGIDINSGFEIHPGIKNFRQIKNFFELLSEEQYE